MYMIPLLNSFVLKIMAKKEKAAWLDSFSLPIIYTIKFKILIIY